MSESKKFEGILMGMGNPLLDISANVDQAFLDKYKVKLDSQILAEEHHQPMYKEIVDTYKDSVQYIAGGATQNSMRVAQWMLSNTSAKMDNQVAFMGCVGDNDDYGKRLEECATADGVFVHYMKDTAKQAPTGTCAALIMDGERSLIANLAAANNFTIDHLQTETAKEIIQSAKYYYCAGFFLTVSVESLVSVAKNTIDSDKIFALNLSAPFIIDFFGDQLATAMEYADYLFGNENEAATYAKKHNLSDDIKELALQMTELPKKNASRKRCVIFTQGSKSTIVAYDGKVTEYAVTPLDSSQLVDTNGAGDAFVGGFLSQLIQDNNKKSIEDCVKAGHYAAKYIIQVSGTTLSKPCEYEG